MATDDTPPPTCPNCGTELNDTDLTTSTKERWEWTGTLLAITTVLPLPVIILLAGLGFFALGMVTQGWWVLYSTVVLMAATWTFGKETLEAVKKARGS